MRDTTTLWNAGLYDDKHAFVFKYGEDLVELLQPKVGEYILDAGCGTGYLTNVIAESGSRVLGIDSSVDMIQKATLQYSNVDFKHADITSFTSHEPFDAVFSNAVLHWVLEAEKAIEHIQAVLKQGGRLVMEMGGKHNVQGIVDALKRVLLKNGYVSQSEKQLWYFPSIGEYTSLLEKNGFRVMYATHYDRETELKDDGTGISDWIQMFASGYLQGISGDKVKNITNEVQHILKPTHFRNGKWYADYKRLRVVAVKE